MVFFFCTSHGAGQLMTSIKIRAEVRCVRGREQNCAPHATNERTINKSPTQFEFYKEEGDRGVEAWKQWGWGCIENLP